MKMEPYHVRHRVFLIFAMVSGFYFTAFNKIIKQPLGIKAMKFYACFAYFFLVLIICSTIYHMIYRADTVFGVLIDFESLFTNSLSSMRSLFIYFNMGLFMKVINKWDEYFQNDEDSDKRLEYMAETQKLVLKTVRRFSIVTYFVLPGWTFGQFFNPEKYMELPVGYDYAHRSPDYEIIVLLHFITYSYYSLILACVDYSLLMPLSWITAEIRRLSDSLANIIAEVDLPTVTENDRREIFKSIDSKLRLWVIQHQKLCKFHTHFSRIYSVCLSIEQMAIVVIALCVSCVVAMKLVGVMNSTFQVIYFTRYFAIFYAACTWGDDIKKESSRIFDSVFDKNWTYLPRVLRTNLKIISMRTQKPLLFNGYKIISLGSPTFLQVLRTSYTLINFISATLGESG